MNLLITPILFNVTYNTGSETRYDMRVMFDVLANTYTFPVRLPGNEFVDYIEIERVFACLPGGRGCVGKERMGEEEENYPALTGGWSGCPDGQLGFPGNPAAM